MSIHHAVAGEPIDISSSAAEATKDQTTTLIKTSRLEVLRLMLPAGKRIDSHAVPGEITIQCLEGTVELEAHGRPQLLTPGTLLYLAGGDQHALRAIEDGTLLITILL